MLQAPEASRKDEPMRVIHDRSPLVWVMAGVLVSACGTSTPTSAPPSGPASSTTAPASSSTTLKAGPRIVDLGVIGSVVDLNDAGQAALSREDPDGAGDAILWSDTGMIELGTIGGSWAMPTGLNDHGDVVGYGPVGPGGRGEHHAWLWRDGTMIDLDPLGGPLSLAYDINNRGQVFGCGANRSPCFIWQDGDITWLPDGFESDVYSINEHGQVVGTYDGRPAVYHDGSISPLAPIPASRPGAYAGAINEAGDVAGYIDVGRNRGALWRDGGLTMLEWYKDPLTHSMVTALNDTGQAAGWVLTNSGGGPTRALAWGDGWLVELGSLGGENSAAEAINSAGQVGGFAQDKSGRRHAVIWVDIPYPAPVAVTGHWEAAGSMATGRLAPKVVRLADWRALVVGNDDCSISDGIACDQSCVRDASATAEIWDPSSGWGYAPELSKPRADFAAVTLVDGRVLVTGGVNAGTTHGWGQSGHQSYSSTYLFESTDPPSTWSRAALLGTARTAPAAATLHDGRVLVAGGYFQGGSTALHDAGTALAFYRPADAQTASLPGAVFADTDPPQMIAGLATAELYDPATDRWSPTGSMRYARAGAQAVTLADGRGLVVGSSVERGAWNYGVLALDDRVDETAELYDPSTGRFTLTGQLAAFDRSAVTDRGYSDTEAYLKQPGTLVALADGGALLVGRTVAWYGYWGADRAFVSGDAVSTQRFDPQSRQWSVIDQRIVARRSAELVETLDEGHSRPHATAVALADGRVLVAGGFEGVHIDGYTSVDTAELYDPTTGAWTALPPMPRPRAGGVAVAFLDGSALIVGGYNEDLPTGSRDCSKSTTGLAGAFRFVPGP